jgi:hypothetical protein
MNKCVCMYVRYVYVAYEGKVLSFENAQKCVRTCISTHTYIHTYIHMNIININKCIFNEPSNPSQIRPHKSAEEFSQRPPWSARSRIAET